MNHNFFQALVPLLASLDSLQVVVAGNSDELVVSVLPKAKNVKDDAVKLVAPLVLRGTPSELDAQFVDALSRPIEKASGLFVALTSFEASVEEAKAKSEMERKEKEEQKKAAEKEKKEREQNDKTVNTALEEAKSEGTSQEASLRKLEELQRKNLPLSPAVAASLESAVSTIKNKISQPKLF